MSEGVVWSEYLNYVRLMDEIKDGIEVEIPGKAIHFDKKVDDCFSHNRPASSDAFFVRGKNTVYVEFKVLSNDEKTTEKIEKQIINKITDTAMIHHRFMKSLPGIKERAIF